MILDRRHFLQRVAAVVIGTCCIREACMHDATESEYATIFGMFFPSGS